MIIPLVIIAFGIFFFAKSLGLVPEDQFNVIWPLVVIVLGLSMLSRKMFGHDCDTKNCEWCKDVTWTKSKGKRK